MTTSTRVVTIIDLQIQNILSVENALRTVGAQVRVVRDAAGIEPADLVILPGVGSFAAAAARLDGSGIREVLKEHALRRYRPVVGLCLGMQLLADSSEEHGTHVGLGLLPGRVVRLTEAPPDYRVPNVGWRTVRLKGQDQPLMPPWIDGRSFYHVHSYHFETTDPIDTAATTRFGATEIASIVQRGKVVGMQFHPEKSQEAGLDLLHAMVCRLH